MYAPRQRWIGFKEERPQTWIELLNCLHPKTPHPVLYRGSPVEGWRILSDLQKHAGARAREAERMALADMLQHSPGERSLRSSPGARGGGCGPDGLLGTLGRMARARGPTRLVPWSRNPLVGLYFAAVHAPSRGSQAIKDAVVWVLDPSALSADRQVSTGSAPSSTFLTCRWQPAPGGLASLSIEASAEDVREALRAAAESSTDAAVASAFRSVSWGSERLPASRAVSSALAELELIEALAAGGGAPQAGGEQPSPAVGGYYVFFTPDLTPSERAQGTVYSLASSPEAVLDEWLERWSPGAVTRVVVPAGLRCEALHKLSIASVTDRQLWPDIGGLTRWVIFSGMPPDSWPQPRAPGSPEPPQAQQSRQREREELAAKERAAAAEQQQQGQKSATEGAVRTYRPESWDEVVAVFFGDDIAWSPEFNVFRSQFIFRGQASTAFKLTTKLQRMAGQYPKALA
eukprot:m51a1_g6467 hypothetical protein (460) ;mRNA; f:60502-61935